MLALNFIAPLCTAAGSVLLAVRVKIFLSAYYDWHRANDIRISYLEDGQIKPGEVRLIVRQGHEWFPKATRCARALFILGVALVLSGSLMSAYAGFVSV
ncbi:MAG: hypothetical protein KUL86_14115 [Castellaniella sp.]|nr:hypothetical protein [Castellaniella sp.]